jgi:molybdopterin converting factor small subunit
MVKIYYRQSGSMESAKYIEYSIEDAQKMLKKALEDEHRIIVNVQTNQRVVDFTKVKLGDIIRVFPIVGGG